MPSTATWTFLACFKFISNVLLSVLDNSMGMCHPVKSLVLSKYLLQNLLSKICTVFKFCAKHALKIPKVLRTPKLRLMFSLASPVVELLEVL